MSGDLRATLDAALDRGIRATRELVRWYPDKSLGGSHEQTILAALLDLHRAALAEPQPDSLDPERLAEAMYEDSCRSFRRKVPPTWAAMKANRTGPYDPQHPANASNGSVIDGWMASASRIAARLTGADKESGDVTPRTEAGKGLDNDLFRVMGHGDDCADCVSDYANFGYTEQIAKAEAEAAASPAAELREAAEELIAERRRDVTPRTGHAFWSALDRLEVILSGGSPATPGPTGPTVSPTPPDGLRAPAAHRLSADPDALRTALDAETLREAMANVIEVLVDLPLQPIDAAAIVDEYLRLAALPPEAPSEPETGL